MKHNNQIPSNHFRKHWQRRVKTWFDQAGKKKSRRLARARKASAAGFTPTSKLRSTVHCPTLKYNTKVREGRGFTLEEIKAAGLSRQYARSIGISVDHRRRNKSQESLDRNVKRLKKYLEHLVVVRKGELSKDITTTVSINGLFNVSSKKGQDVQTAELSSEMKSLSAYSTLRKAWGVARHAGIRAKRAAAKAEEASQAVKSK